MGAVEEVIDYRALLNGWQRVFSNGGMAGMDGISLSDFARNVDAELASLARAVRAGDYRPGPLKTAELQRYGRRPRILAVPSVRDRVLHTAIANWLMPRLEPHFERCSYGYRPGRSYLDAVAEVCRHRDQGLRWVVDADIAQYFDQINQQLLLEELARLIPDQPLLQLIRLSLFGEQGRVAPLAFGSGPGLGLPQGSPLSPLLANLYLDPFDDAMLAAGHALVRYADDFLVMCRNQAGALAVHGQVAGLLAARGLRLNEDKTRITNFELGFAFLGHNFVADMVFDDRSQRPFDVGEWRQRSGEPRGHSRHWGWQPPAATIQPSPPAVQPLWAEAADTGLATAEQAVDDGEPLLAEEPADDANDDVELLPPTAALAALQAAIDDEEPPSPLPLPVNGYARLHTLYVARQGAVVGRSGNQFHITLKGELVQKVPANNLDAVCLLGRIQVTRDAMTHCLLNGIAVIFATHNGQYLGQLDNSTLLKTSLISRQVAHSSEPATRL
ncbi:MAG: CRISPR-associated endonuclease Cas1, partial [Corallincola sp.]|nr:CRISPR-associated endonuclease Cas1 [Corallincola sp.]